MKKIIIIITALELLTACGVSRRAVKTEITSEVTQQTLTTDTTSRATTWEQLVTAISNQIDLSKIHIINYSPERDSTGKQIIDSEIKIDRNVTTTTKADVKESKEEQENRITTESTDTQAKEQTKQETKEKTGSSPLRLYLIIALLTAVLLLIIYIKYKSVIGSVIKKIFGSFT
jgi:cobalamin biosynthesis Mg chelatase CobN